MKIRILLFIMLILVNCHNIFAAEKELFSTPTALADGVLSSGLPNKEKLAMFIRETRQIGDSSIAYFVPIKDFSSIKYFQNNNALLINYVYPGITYNTLTMGKREMASQIVGEIAVPYAAKLYQYLSNSVYEQIDVTIYYKFGNARLDYLDANSAAVELWVSKALLEKYVSAEITDQELVNQSVVKYNEFDGTSWRRISVNLR